MNHNELPLLELFNHLRKCGLPLGIEEYLALVRALRAGFGVGDYQTLKRLCCTIWIKSTEEMRLFERIFDSLLTQSGERSPEIMETGLSSPLPGSFTSPSLEMRLHKQSSSTSVFAVPMLSAGLILEIDETIQVVQAIRAGAKPELHMRPRYAMANEYFPVTRRQMKQSWRHLRRAVREGPLEELDERATADKIRREGVLLEPVMVPRRTNRIELVLLIDRDGSMAPFHSLSEQLIETAERGGRLRKVDVRYFHDYPADFLYRDRARVQGQLTTAFFGALDQHTVVLIVSDAGAARGNFDLERIERTNVFVQELGQSVRRHAWLNPMPQVRWTDTTAEQVAKAAPMFEMSRRGFDMAIGLLRGLFSCW